MLNNGKISFQGELLIKLNFAQLHSQNSAKQSKSTVLCVMPEESRVQLFNKCFTLQVLASFKKSVEIGSIMYTRRSRTPQEPATGSAVR